MKIKKLLAIILAITMTLSYIPNTAFASDALSTFKDMPAEGFWSTEALKEAVSNGLINGFVEKDGTYIRPNNPITRAQIATIVNRAFGVKEMASLSGNSDVIANAWYYKEMQKAVMMGTMKMAISMRPNDNITRQEAFTILGRALKMEDGSKSDLAKFSDASQIADWAITSMGAMVKAGYIKGDNNLLNPKANMTRAQFAVVMNNVIKEYITKPGTFKKVATGNIMVNIAGVTLENLTIKGDLIIGDGVGNGKVTLNNVIVEGNIIDRSSKGGIIADGVPVSAIIVTGENNVTKITTTNGTLQMLADVKPTTATNKTVKWSVTNEDGSVTDKATINSNGLLTAVKNGKVKVKATSTSTPTVSDELGIEISGQLLPSTIVFNDAGPIAKIVGDAAFTNKVTGGDGDGAITYTSETPRTATVNKTTGEVTIVAVGSTVITATKAATKTHSEVTNNYSINIGNKASTAITKVEIIGDRFIGTELKTSLTPKEATALYQWKRVRFSPGPIVEDIVGATADKYTVTKEDNNWKIFVQVQGTGNYVGTIKSVETSAIMHNAIKERVVTATDVTAGQTLKQSKLSGTFKDFVKEEVSGKLEWVDSTTVVNKTGEYSWKFTPDNSVIYYPTTGVVNVKAIITDFAGGSGTITDPYKVSNVEQLNNVRKYLDKYFIQINDIDLNSGSFGSGEGWVPIGNMTNNFTGSYNGQGKEIKSLTIEAPKASRIGLFGQTSKGAKLSNIIINSCLVRGDAQVGALVGYNLGEVLNCKIYGDKETYIRGNNSVGGMVGYNKGTIDGCTGTTGYNVYGSIDTGGLVGTNDEGVVKSSNSSCVTKGDNNVGGLVGRNQGEIYNNYTENSQCEVNSGPDGKGKSWVKEVNIGGLVGANTGTISSCSAQNILVELQDKGVGGGLVGKNMGSIYQSYSKINNVRGFTNLGGEDICDLGGLVGYNSGTISQSFAKMNGISPVKGLYRLGGLVGSNAGTISDTYSTCSVDGHNDMGGLVGKNYKGSTISNSYAIGFIERRQLGKINWAGIVGYNDGTVKDCYYDKKTTGRDDKGKGNPKTTEEMSVQSTFKNWDFKRIWTIGTDRYPILQWQSE